MLVERAPGAGSLEAPALGLSASALLAYMYAPLLLGPRFAVEPSCPPPCLISMYFDISYGLKMFL